MDVKLTRVSQLERRLTVVIGASQLNQRYRDELEQASKRANLRGFRPGQVPSRAIEQRYGEQIRKEVIGELMQQSLYDAISENNLRPAAAPVVDGWEDKPDGSVEFVADMEVMPDIKFTGKQLSKLKLTRYKAAISDSDVEQGLQRLLDNNPDWEPASAPAEHGNRLSCDFSGRVNGEPFPGGDASDYEFILGKGEAIPGFEEQLVGMSTGDEKAFELDVPEEHPREEVRGRRVRFEVKVLKVERAIAAELNDKLAERMTPPGEEKPYDVAALRQKIREHLQEDLENILKNRTREKLLDALSEVAKFAVPKVLLDERVQKLQQQTGADAETDIDAGTGASKGEESVIRKLMLWGRREEKKAVREREKEQQRQREKVEAELRSALLLGHIADEQNIQADAAEVREEINRRAWAMSNGQNTEEMVKLFYQNENILNNVESNVREAKVIDAVLEQSTTSNHELGYEQTLELFKSESEADEK